MTDPGPLSAFQQEVASVFFDLAASEGFLLAGGAALVANQLTTRPTQDLDFFRSTSTVTAARDELEQAAAERGWPARRIRDEATFVRLLIEGPETVLVDLCLDSPPIRPPVKTPLGPTFAPDELAARKVIAVFDRPRPETSLTCSRSSIASRKTSCSAWPTRSIRDSTL